MVDALFLLLSLVMYFAAPTVFSSEYCWILLMLFLLQASIVNIRDMSNEKLGFNVLFTFAFFLVVYLYPIFISPFFPDFQILSIPIFDYTSVTKCTALANIAYSSYCVGYAHISFAPDAIKDPKPFEIPQILERKQQRLLVLVSLMLFAVFVATGGLEIFRNLYSEHGESDSGGPAGFIWVLLQIVLILLSISNLHINSKAVYIFLGGVCLMLLSLGTRTLPLNILVPVICTYAVKKDLSMVKMLSMGTVLIVAFAAVGILRNSSSAMDAAGGDAIAERFRTLMDFIIPNRDLYAIYNHVQEDGITYGVSSLSYILAAVPLSQSLFMGLTGLPEYELRSERLVTFWEFGDNPDAWGLGTNIIGDVYLSFGFIGVVVLFVLLGYFIARTRKAYKSGSAAGMVIYLTMLSGVIFMCRGSYFFMFKNILWSFIIVHVIRSLYKPVEE